MRTMSVVPLNWRDTVSQSVDRPTGGGGVRRNLLLGTAEFSRMYFKI
jgi:hypothetical protein